MDTPVRAALFLDRDGTIIADAHYLADPAGVRLLPEAAHAIVQANDAGIPVVVVTNQSGIARGLITLAQYEAVHRRMLDRLAARGARIDAAYHCPHWPGATGPCDCRKPGLGMYRDAARDHGFDLAASAYVGDRWRDVQPAIETGGFGVLVPGRETPSDDLELARQAVGPRLRLAASLGEAVTLALASMAAPSVASPPAASPTTRQGETRAD